MGATNKDHRTSSPELCDDCGACCFEQGSPPGYELFVVDPAPAWVSEIPADDPDRLRAAALPPEARKAIRLYHASLTAGKGDGDRPCCWLDLATNRCRWYEHRPEICRELMPGSEGCQAWRDEYNLDVTAPDPLTLLMDAVAEMRHAQKEYFRTRSQAALVASKSAEAKVDKLLAELREPKLF